MKRFFIQANLLLLVTLVSARCDSNTSTNFIAPTEVTFGLADFAEIMFARGIPIEIGEEEGVDYFPVPVRHFTLFGEDVLVFEFAGRNTATAVAAAVSPDGTTINGRVIDWPATPHFFVSGRVIALYLGDDIRVIASLQEIMGPQFAGGEVNFTVQE